MARRLITVGALVLVAVACADDEPVLDPAIIPAAVQAEVEPVGVQAVACDDPAAQDLTLPETGGRFACGGILNGDPVVIDVTVSPAFDGEIGVAAEIRTPLFDVAAVETAAAARLDVDLGGAPEVDCVERLVVIEPGRRIDCRVTAEGGTAGPVDRALVVEILDDQGNWEIELFASVDE